MWTHPATTRNVARLRADGDVDRRARCRRRSPRGNRASGGWPSCPGSWTRSSRPSRTARSASPTRRPGPRWSRRARDADLSGRHVVVTVGGTREAIDPVRFIGNRSTGRMGVAVAEAALARGARVTLLAASVEVPLPPGADVVRVESTADLRAALLRTTHAADGSAGFDALVMAAAVADFRPVRRPSASSSAAAA